LHVLVRREAVTISRKKTPRLYREGWPDQPLIRAINYPDE